MLVALAFDATGFFYMKMCPNDRLPTRGLKTLLFLDGYVNDLVFHPLLPSKIDDLKHRITKAINSVNCNMLLCVWEEFTYCLHVVHTASCVHIEHL